MTLRMLAVRALPQRASVPADHDPGGVDDARDVGEHAADGVAGIVDDAAHAGVVCGQQRQQIVDVEVGSVRDTQGIEQRSGGRNRAETAAAAAPAQCAVRFDLDVPDLSRQSGGAVLE